MFKRGFSSAGLSYPPLIFKSTWPSPTVRSQCELTTDYHYIAPSIGRYQYCGSRGLKLKRFSYSLCCPGFGTAPRQEAAHPSSAHRPRPAAAPGRYTSLPLLYSPKHTETGCPSLYLTDTQSFIGRRCGEQFTILSVTTPHNKTSSVCVTFTRVWRHRESNP